MKKLHDYLIHAYMLSSILATLCLIPYTEAAGWLYLLGGSSSLYGFAYIIGDWASPIFGMFAFCWMILFPIVLVIFYILARKEIYLPFFILTTLDAAFVLVAGLLLLRPDWMDSFFLWDTIASTAFSVVLGGILLYRHNHLEQYL